MIKKSLLFTAALALASNVASAAIVWTPVQSFNNALAFNYNTTVGINQFDSSLGPLVAVRFSLTGAVAGSQQVDNNAASPVNAQMTTGASMTMAYNFGFGDVTLVNTLPTAVNNASLSADDGDGGGNFTGSDSASFFNVTATQTVTNDWDTSDGFLWGLISSTFTGNGTVNLNLSGNATSGATGSGSILQLFSTTGTTSGYVQYGYDSPVPEPGTYAMLGSGLVLFGLYRRRRA